MERCGEEEGMDWAEQEGLFRAESEEGWKRNISEEGMLQTTRENEEQTIET